MVTNCFIGVKTIFFINHPRTPLFFFLQFPQFFSMAKEQGVGICSSFGKPIARSPSPAERFIKSVSFKPLKPRPKSVIPPPNNPSHFSRIPNSLT